jgi:hypothetical protein
MFALRYFGQLEGTLLIIEAIEEQKVIGSKPTGLPPEE